MKSVVICSSSKFAKESMVFAEKLKKLGGTVYTPHYYKHHHTDLEKIEGHNKKYIAMGLAHDHFNKIRLSDVVFIYNKDGYIGPSTTLEIGFAVALNKPIYALSEDKTEICRNILFRGIINSPKEILKILK